MIFSLQFGQLVTFFAMALLDVGIHIYSAKNNATLPPILKQGSIYPSGGDWDITNIALLNNGNNQCLDENWAVGDDAITFTWPCSYGDNQIWDLQYTGNFVYTSEGKHAVFQIVNKYTGKAACIFKGDVYNDALVVIYSSTDPSSDLNSHWYSKWVDETSDFFYIVHQRSGRCLTVSMTHEGQTAYIYDCVSHISQRWRIDS